MLTLDSHSRVTRAVRTNQGRPHQPGERTTPLTGEGKRRGKRLAPPAAAEASTTPLRSPGLHRPTCPATDRERRQRSIAPLRITKAEGPPLQSKDGPLWWIQLVEYPPNETGFSDPRSRSLLAKATASGVAKASDAADGQRHNRGRLWNSTDSANLVCTTTGVVVGERTESACP